MHEKRLSENLISFPEINPHVTNRINLFLKKALTTPLLHSTGIAKR
jgi:hypothetical protein